MTKFFKSIRVLVLLFVLSLGAALPAFAEDVNDVSPPNEGTQIDGAQTETPSTTCHIDELGQKVCEQTYSAGWDYIGNDLFYLPKQTVGGGAYQQEGDIHYSTGGGYKILIPAQDIDIYPSSPYTPAITIELWEDDGTYGDDYIKTWVIYPKTYAQSVSIDTADKWVDGLNGYAEFYIKATFNYSVTGDQTWIRFYD